MIRAREVRAIGPDGAQLGIMPLERALAIAEEMDMDLVEVAPMARPPVCKIMDYGRYKYHQAKKAQEARKRQVHTQVKEVKIRPKTDEHDFQVKLKKVKEFLEGGHKVKITVMFRGREVTLPEKGLEQLEKMLQNLTGEARVENPPRMEGRTMSMMLAPARAASKKS